MHRGAVQLPRLAQVGVRTATMRLSPYSDAAAAPAASRTRMLVLRPRCWSSTLLPERDTVAQKITDCPPRQLARSQKLRLQRLRRGPRPCRMALDSLVHICRCHASAICTHATAFPIVTTCILMDFSADVRAGDVCGRGASEGCTLVCTFNSLSSCPAYSCPSAPSVHASPSWSCPVPSVRSCAC